MFIRKTVKKGKNKIYENYLLVESIATPKGPRQKTICSLGNLKPGPREKWYKLAKKIENALSGQITLELDDEDKELEDRVREILKKINKYKKEKKRAAKNNKLQEKEDKNNKEEEIIEVLVDKVETEEHREAGPVHVGLEYWKMLKLDKILKESGLDEKACELTKIMTMNRLIYPKSENAMVNWIKNSALGDLLGRDYSDLNSDRLYRNMDKLYEKRGEIEKKLSEREKILFNLDTTIYLYDLTSTYFEGICLKNPQAKRGYSKDGRPDCKQVVIGIAFNRDGFPLAHEIFDGNQSEKKTVKKMLDLLEKRCGNIKCNTIVMDRGMVTDENLKEIKSRGCHYIIAGRQSERGELLDEYEASEGWDEIIREVSASNLYQKKSSVKVKTVEDLVYTITENTLEKLEGKIDINRLEPLLAREFSSKSLTKKLRKLKLKEQEIDEIISSCNHREEIKILCISEGRSEKDRAIREGKEKKLLEDLEKLKGRIQKGQIKNKDKVNQAIGRLKERYPLVCRYYEITYNREFEVTREIIKSLEEEIDSDKLTSIGSLIGNKFSHELLWVKLKELGFTKSKSKIIAKFCDNRMLIWKELEEKKEKAKDLDGAYLLKTDRLDIDKEEIWRIYSLLTRAEDAFRAMKSPLVERPIFHQLENRVQTHIFLCILAYHLLVAIETNLRNNGLYTSWPTVRDILKTHQVCTVVLPTPWGLVRKIRKGSSPEPQHKVIYDKLGITSILMKPKKIWHYIDETEKNSDGIFT